MIKVLIGEDDPTQAMYLRRLLTKISEVETVIYGDGLSLYQAVQENIPDLIICDNVLPKLDGLSVARLIKFHERTRMIPYLLVSSIPAEQLEGYTESGADAFLAKPINRGKLEETIKQLTGLAV